MESMRAKRVLVVSQLPPPIHGSTVMTKTFLSSLDSLGVSYRLVDRRFSRSVDEIGEFSGGKVLAAVSLALRLASAAVQRGQICVFFSTNRPQSFLVDFVLSVILSVLRVPRITYVHTQGYRELAHRGPVWAFMVRRLLGSSATVVVLSEGLAADVVSWVKPANIVVIANTLSEPAPTDRRSRSSTVRVLFLSNLIPSKGVLEFIKICSAVAGRMPEKDFEFNIVGPSSSEEFAARVRDEIARSDHAQQFRLAGPQHGEAKWAHLVQANLLVFPSVYSYEAQPVTIIEALSVGTPVVAYNTGGIADMIESGVSGFVVDSAAEAIEAAHTIIQDAALHDRIATAGRSHFEQKFSRPAFTTAWRKVLESH
jgi:glycosyltransferase involved in cell wall biosynthesis